MPWRALSRPRRPIPVTPAAAGRILGKVHALRLPAPGCVGSWLTRVRSEAEWCALQTAAESAGRPWARRLAEVIPEILDVSGLVEPVDPEAALVLSGRHYAPNAFCVAGPDDLAVMTWEHAGPIPPRWDVGGPLARWSQGVAGRVNAPAARAFLAGYAAEYEAPEPLDPGIFSAALCAGMSWLSSRIRIALTEPDPDRSDAADRAVPWLLKDLPSRAWFDAVLDAAT